MNEPIETVKIVREDLPGGVLIINKEDLKPEDAIYGEEKTPTKKGKKK